MPPMRRCGAERRCDTAAQCYLHRMDPVRDSIYYEQLARVARQKAYATEDPFLAVRLKEAAIKYERTARKLQRNPA